MSRRMTLSQRIAAAFAVLVLFSVVIAIMAVLSLRRVTSAQAEAAQRNSNTLITMQTAQVDAERMIAAFRGYLLTRDAAELDDLRESADDLVARVGLLKERTDAGAHPLLDALGQTVAEYQTAAEALAAREDLRTAEVLAAWQQQVKPLSKRFEGQLSELTAMAEQDLDRSREQAARATAVSTVTLVVIAITAVVLSTLLAWLLSRALTRQVGSAVSHLQTSSTQLQAASQQQATTAKEQATATTEVTTTVRELLASSRQMGESAQRVASAAEQTSGAAQAGDDALRAAQQQMTAIQRQVDRIVEHMLDLGRKSQQVGSILEIIDELAEQTNILAINATIESAGAGESGRRFAVVAEEIRRLADRVGSSTREIRGLVEEIRAAANTTAMATEEGSKTADAGARQFEEVTSRFAEINDLVVTTLETAREIELGTRQQTTAVEQVNQAIGHLSQSAREVETGSRETVQVASRLADLSKALMRLVRRQRTEVPA